MLILRPAGIFERDEISGPALRRRLGVRYPDAPPAGRDANERLNQSEHPLLPPHGLPGQTRQ